LPTIECSHKDLCSLIGKKLSKEELEDALLCVKGEIEEWSGDVFKVEIADTNRPDLWSAEGIARELRSHLLRKPYKPVKPRKSGLKVRVDPSLERIRPRTVCAVAKNVKVTEQMLSQLIQLQEKVAETYGRKRREVAIGVYDYSIIRGPITFTAADPDKTRFVPLGMSQELTLRQILAKHEKGREYGHLLEKHKRYPLFADSKGEILSMPPIINSAKTGQVTEKTKELFIECSGFDTGVLHTALIIICEALRERGAEILSVDVEYSYGKKETLTFPDFTPKKTLLEIEFLNHRPTMRARCGAVVWEWAAVLR